MFSSTLNVLDESTVVHSHRATDREILFCVDLITLDISIFVILKKS